MTFNNGCQQALLPVLVGVGAQPGPSCFSVLAGKDACRVSHAESHEAALVKLRRKSKRVVEKEREEALIQAGA